MALTTIDFGSQVDFLNKDELRAALAEDAALRRIVTGVKIEEFSAFSQQTQVAGAAVPYYTTPVNMVGGGLMWAVMTCGLEISASQASRVYKGIPAGPTPTIQTGTGRVVQQTAASTTPSFAFSKGQCTLRAGEQLTFVVSGAGNILSVYIAAISCPAERFAELLV
jgi:hypothetical protein